MKQYRIGVLAVMMAGAVQGADAQADVKARTELAPRFFFDAICYSSEMEGKSRIDFYVQVPYEELRFVKEGENFAAKYEITLTIAKAAQKAVDERSWSVDVRLPEFARTVSRNAYSLTQRAIDIEPGEYHVLVQLKDQDSQRIGRIRRSLLVTDFEKDSLSLSDIMLVSRLTTEGEKKRIVPNISGVIASAGEGFFLFFEAYATPVPDSLAFSWKIFNKDKEEINQGIQVERNPSAKTQVFVKVEDLRLPVGPYFISVEAHPRRGENPDTTLRAMTSRSFSVRWSNIPGTISDLKKAAEQLKYVAQPSEYDHILEAETEEELKNRFLDFWSKRDSDPSTERNELMEEYYERVEYSNTNFGHYTDGWKTDRGMIYIRFGAPDNIERHPFDINTKPYEVWYYYELERQFIFVDETGFGDYRLRYPTTDLWGRVR